MKVTMVMVASVDGKTTQGNNQDIYRWSSIEDKKHFYSLIKKNSLIIMGRSTYAASRSIIKLEPGRLRIVLTHHPKKFENQSVKGQLEFTNETPKKLIKRLSNLGYNKALLVGGSIINGLFLKDNLVDELYLTVEPKLFGSGKNISDGQLLDCSLTLVSVKKMNKAGTLLLKYKYVH